MSQDYSDSNIVPLSWERIHHDAIALADRLRGRGPFKGIVAIARGGMIPAAIVAYHLKLRLLDTISIATYVDKVEGEARVLKRMDHDGAGWLVIDDLVDSGTTARVVRELLPRAHYAAVYAKPMGRADAHTVQVEVAQEEWLAFPWEEGDAD